MRRWRCLIFASFVARTWVAPVEEVKAPKGRRGLLLAAGCASGCAAADALELSEPLVYCGGGFCAAFRLGGQLFRGVVDTGSPFLLVSTCEGDSCANYCRAWGCTTEKLGQPSGLKDTDELFAAGLARVSWKRNPFQLGGERLGSVTYGAILEVESYGGNGGGAFLGLVREKSARIRPTLLGQTSVRTVTVDLRSPGEERLSLSSAAPEKGLGAQMLDLRPSGAPVRYYAVEATGLRVAGQRLELPGPLVAVLDTGTTGLGLPSKLFESYDRLRREVAQDYGLQRAQAVDLLVRMEDGSELSLGLRPGRQKAYKQDRFDIVTPLPEPSGMNADASALWAGQGLAGAVAMRLRDGKFIAEAPAARGSVGWAQADRPVSRGDRFLVRLLPSGPGRLPCNGSVGLAPRGARLSKDVASYTKLLPGDLVECRLGEDGEDGLVFIVNGKKVAFSEPLDTKRNVYPTVELAAGCDCELLSSPSGSSMDEGQQGMGWAEPAEAMKAEKPTVLFMGLGFLLGRQVSIDTLANRAIFS